MTAKRVPCDVRVTGARKSYGSNNILKGLDMHVSSGSIYGLLGASGCGKSTLLQCILGIIPLDSGSIDLKADSLSDIGYMPQDLCLDNLLTIKEIMDYYGTLYDMNKEQIKSRVEELNIFLQLPNMNSYIKDISGGQGRRVSLAVSILHNPKIIILDEPTVGIDPLLRQEIWNTFSRMVQKHKKTIIITTHYIEEASKADRIGLMRNGMLLEEESPQHILVKYETDTLEAAFLTLCCKQKAAEQVVHNDAPDIYVRETVQTQSKHLKKSGSNLKMNRVMALIKKNFYVLVRDYLLLVTLIVLPTLQAFNLCFGVGVNIKDLKIAVMSDEIKLSNCNNSRVSGCIFDEDRNRAMSCVTMAYLGSLNYKLVEVDDREAGKLMMKHYKSIAFLYFPNNYTRDLINYVGEDRSNYNFESPVYVDIDKDNLVLKNQILKDVTDSFQHLLRKTLSGCSNNPRALGIPMEFNIVTGKEVKSYLNSLAAIFIAMGAFYFPSLFSVSLMLSERMDGILDRSMFAGVTILELLISLFCITTLILFFQIFIPIIVVYVLFANPIMITNGIFVYFSILIFLGWIGFFYGILIAGLSTTKLGGVYAINGLSISQFLLSGFVWPIEGQAPWLRTVSMLLPMRVAGTTMNDIALKGWTWDHPSVVYGMAMTFGQTVAMVALLVGLGKVKRDMWVLNK